MRPSAVVPWRASLMIRRGKRFLRLLAVFLDFMVNGSLDRVDFDGLDKMPITTGLFGFAVCLASPYPESTMIGNCSNFGWVLICRASS